MVTIKINAIDRTSLIDWRTFVFNQAITSQIDTLNFVIKRYDTKTFKPSLLDDVEVFEDSTKLFGGKIVRSEEVIDGRLQGFRVSCKDHSHEMDSTLVIKTFENTTVDAIIADIIATFLPAGFTGTGVTVTTPVNFIAFNYEQPSKVFQQLAELTGADWFVDVDKDIQFFLKNALVSPFDLDDTSGNYVFNSLKINRDVKNLRNTIFVRGGTFSGDLFEEIQEADGVTETFDFGFRYKSVGWFVDRGSGFVAETFGIDNITDPTTVDWNYNFTEKAMKLASASIPSAGNKIKITGLPQIPVIIKSRDNVSIGTFGEFEHKIIDKSLDSKEGARDRARGELIAWADKINEGSFETRKSGLIAGQSIRVQSTIRGIDERFVISRVSTKFETPTQLIHQVILITQRTFGMVEFLQKLLIDKDKEIEINPDEVLDKIESAIESINFAEAVQSSTDHNKQLEAVAMGEVVVDAKDNGTIFVYAPFPVPTGLKRQGHFDGAVFA